MSNLQGTGTREDQGSFVLFKPAAATSIAAIYGHGVENNEIEPISGVTLGYYCAHGDTVLANITWAASQPSEPALLPNGKWSNYTLSSLKLDPRTVDELLNTANASSVAIAYISNPTSTSDIISQLSGMGYTELRGVHCRESLSKSEAAEYGLPTEIDHETLVTDGWLDPATEPITDDTTLEKDNDICDAGYKIYKIVEVVSASAPKQYKIARKLD